MHPIPKFNSFVLFWTCHKVKVFMDQIENHQNRPDSNPCSLFACYVVQPKSLYISPELSHLYGAEYEIWAGFGLVRSTENCPTQTTFEGSFYMHIFPALRAIWFLEKTVLRKNRVSGTVLMFELTRNFPTCAYIGQNPHKWKLHYMDRRCYCIGKKNMVEIPHCTTFL